MSKSEGPTRAGYARRGMVLLEKVTSDSDAIIIADRVTSAMRRPFMLRPWRG